MRLMGVVAMMCPLITCPPISSPKRAARSRFTLSPVFRLPKLVLARVSAIRSKVAWLPLIWVMVRQQPLWAMDAPICRLCAMCSGRATVWLRKSALGWWMWTILPVPCTMPVNMAVPCGGVEEGGILAFLWVGF